MSLSRSDAWDICCLFSNGSGTKHSNNKIAGQINHHLLCVWRTIWKISACSAVLTTLQAHQCVADLLLQWCRAVGKDEASRQEEKEENKQQRRKRSKFHFRTQLCETWHAEMWICSARDTSNDMPGSAVAIYIGLVAYQSRRLSCVAEEKRLQIECVVCVCVWCSSICIGIHCMFVRMWPTSRKRNQYWGRQRSFRVFGFCWIAYHRQQQQQ